MLAILFCYLKSYPIVPSVSFNNTPHEVTLQAAVRYLSSRMKFLDLPILSTKSFTNSRYTVMLDRLEIEKNQFFLIILIQHPNVSRLFLFHLHQPKE